MKDSILYTWNSVALNPEAAASSKFLDLSSLPLVDALPVAYPKLSYCELLDVLKKLRPSLNLDESAVFEQYGLCLDSSLIELNAVVDQLPRAFWSWCLSHQLSPRDLAPLVSLKSFLEIELSLQKICEINPSRSLGAQLLELIVECAMLGTSDKDLVDRASQPPSSMTVADHWLMQLKTLRYPQSFQAESEKKKQLLSLPWTKDLQTRWLRSGDRSGLEVKFFASSTKELAQHAEQLKKIAEQQKGTDVSP